MCFHTNVQQNKIIKRWHLILKRSKVNLAVMPDSIMSFLDIIQHWTCGHVQYVCDWLVGGGVQQHSCRSRWIAKHYPWSFVPSCSRQIAQKLFNGYVLHFLLMHPDVAAPLWTAVWRSGFHRDWGNLLAMLKQALPKHAASNDLLKKHISTPFS